MRKKIALVLLVVGVWAQTATAVDLANLRATNGPTGAKRDDNKYLPGDLLYLSFDIKDIQLDAKNGSILYQTMLEILDKDNKVIFKQQTVPQKIVLLGSNQLRSSAFAILGTGQEKGKYKVKLTVNDLLAKKDTSVFYDFEVLPPGFGFVQMATPALAFAGQDYNVAFSLVGMKKDEKEKIPDVTISLRIFNEFGKEITTKPWELNVQLFHNPPAMDLTNKEVIPVGFTLFLNRAGKYTIQVDAVDEISKEKLQMKLPLKVLDSAELIGN